jgi:hypothetical protein
MLKHDEAKFLDDLTVEVLAQELHTPIIPVTNITDFLEAIGLIPSGSDGNGE